MSDPYDFFVTPKPPAAEPAAPVPPPPAPAPSRFGGQQLWQLDPGGYGPPPVAPQSVRPGTVTAAAVLVFVQCGFWVLIGLAMVGLALWAGSQTAGGPVALPGLGEVVAVVGVAGVVVLAFAGFLVYCGIRVLAGQAWAAITVVVFEALGVLGALLSLVQGDVVSAVMTGAMPVATVVCLLSTDARRWLGLEK